MPAASNGVGGRNDSKNPWKIRSRSDDGVGSYLISHASTFTCIMIFRIYVTCWHQRHDSADSSLKQNTKSKLIVSDSSEHWNHFSSQHLTISLGPCLMIQVHL